MHLSTLVLQIFIALHNSLQFSRWLEGDQRKSLPLPLEISVDTAHIFQTVYFAAMEARLCL